MRVTVMTKVENFGFRVSELELQSLYGVLFRTNTFWKGLKPLIPLAMGSFV